MGADSTFSKGDRVDRYEIRELIGEGGMGAIYQAVDTRLGKTVALKVVRADRLGSSAGDQARQRFLREALAISKVDHRNVVRVLDFGFSGDTPYLAMEYLRGQDLGKIVKASSGGLPVGEVVEVMLGVCAAIRACHDAGIIHRDLKPSNIFLCDHDSERVVKILDFGVSKPELASDLTREGQIVGTPQYLAPEQIDGKAVLQTDQYAIGVMLYLCLTKSLPYQNYASFGLLRAILAGKFPPPCTLRSDLPEKLEAIILRAMRAGPEERFESVYALGRELWEFAGSETREQWRSYYRDERLKAPPKASTHAMPLIEAMARGLAAGAPLRNTAALAPTAMADPPGDVQKPKPADAAAGAVAERPTPAVAEKSTPVAAERPIPAEALPTPGTVAEQQTGGPRAKRWAMPSLIVAGAVMVAAAAAWLSRGPEPAAAPAAPVSAATVVAPPPNPPEPARPVPAVAPPEAAAPGPRHEQAAAARPVAPAPARADKRHRRNNRQSSSEQAGDGVPIMP